MILNLVCMRHRPQRKLWVLRQSYYSCKETPGSPGGLLPQLKGTESACESTYLNGQNACLHNRYRKKNRLELGNRIWDDGTQVRRNILKEEWSVQKKLRRAHVKKRIQSQNVSYNRGLAALKLKPDHSHPLLFKLNPSLCHAHVLHCRCYQVFPGSD